jgi:hypothetical protein
MGRKSHTWAPLNVCQHLEIENFRLQRKIKWIKSAPYYFTSNCSIVFLATTLVEENARVGRSEPLPKTTYRVIKHGSRLSHLRVCPLNLLTHIISFYLLTFVKLLRTCLDLSAYAIVVRCRDESISLNEVSLNILTGIINSRDFETP